MKEARLRRMKKEKTIPRPVTAAGSKHVLDRIRNMEFGVRNCRETEAVGAADRQPAVLPPAGEGAPVRTLERMREKQSLSPSIIISSLTCQLR